MLYNTYDVPYLLTDLSYLSIKDLINRMEKDSVLFETYYEHNLIKKQGTCSEKCKLIHLCSMNYVHNDEFIACLKKYFFDYLLKRKKNNYRE